LNSGFRKDADIVWRANQGGLRGCYQAPVMDPGKNDSLCAYIAQSKASMPDMNY
jgi:hypothetical protein